MIYFRLPKMGIECDEKYSREQGSKSAEWSSERSGAMERSPWKKLERSGGAEISKIFEFFTIFKYFFPKFAQKGLRRSNIAPCRRSAPLKRSKSSIWRNFNVDPLRVQNFTWSGAERWSGDWKNRWSGAEFERSAPLKTRSTAPRILNPALGDELYFNKKQV